MTRGEHRFQKDGSCRRCGLMRHARQATGSPSSYGGPQCPPGYWMKKAELEEWVELDGRAQAAMERELGMKPFRNQRFVS
jgi:hypothetical protein